MSFNMNEFTVPDFPEGMIDNYPYVCVYTAYDEDGMGVMLQMLASTEKTYFCPATVEANGTGEDCLFLPASSYLSYMNCPEVAEYASQWIDCGTENSEATMVSLTELSLFWANHDIMTIAEIDDNYNVVASEEVYLLNCEAERPEYYAVPAATLVDIAGIARNHTKTYKLLSMDGLKSALESLPCSIYSWIESTTAAGTLELSGDIETVKVVPPYLKDIITAISFPSATEVAVDAFRGCAYLMTANLPAVTTLGDSAFFECEQLNQINIPNLLDIPQFAFTSSAITKADFPVARTIDNGAFRLCSNLTTLILRKSDGIVTFPYFNNGNVLISTPIANGTGYIYVPSALVDTYKAHAEWSTYANQFRAIEDYPDICGTT